MAAKLNTLHVLYIVFLCELWTCTKAEVFTALTECEPLLDTYKIVIDDLDKYIRKEEARLQVLQRKLDVYKKEHEIAMKDVPDYLGNPLNIFTLVKRLTTDLDNIEERVNGTVFSKNANVSLVYETPVKYPSYEDLTGAATALSRLQATYKLEVDELAEGVIKGVKYSLPMSASDCFGLGVALYWNADYKTAVDWLKKALSKFDEENSDLYSFTKVEVMDFISWAYHTLGDAHNALAWIKELLALDPNHTRANQNLLLFEQKIAENGDEQPKPVANVEWQNYEALCRGELEPAPEYTKRLTCFYLTKNHPFLRLAPIKAEQHYEDPDVFVFYDVMSDNEIEHIKAVAKPLFKRATVYDPVTGEQVGVDYRISKSAFLVSDDVISRVTQRITDFTGLSMERAELLQVVNYGIGGHYIPHYDHALKYEKENSIKKDKDGNRIATVLFYMSEVALGGATVFTKLGLSVFPVKNAALFWMNLHPSGEGDQSTEHAGCPVLRGSKWVSNKWIRMAGQEFLRPCTLEYQPEGEARQFPRPVPKSSTTTT